MAGMKNREVQGESQKKGKRIQEEPRRKSRDIQRESQRKSKDIQKEPQRKSRDIQKESGRSVREIQIESERINKDIQKESEKKNKKNKDIHSKNKETWKAGNMLYPLPVVMVSLRDGRGRDNIITVAWTGTVCTDPPMVYISVRPSRYSYAILEETGEFVINLVSRELAEAADYCGVVSGRDVDKFEKAHLTREEGTFVGAPMIAESPVSIECRVNQAVPLGSHTMFLADVLAVHVNQALVDGKNRLALEKASLVIYSHGNYQLAGSELGKFGFSVKKDRKKA